MPRNPVDSLIMLTETIEVLDKAQIAIDNTRSRWPESGRIQLEMDRAQVRVDARRELVAQAMLDISSRN